MESVKTSRSPKAGEENSPAIGMKRSAPALLPAFEPLSSSPPLPRPSKRVARDPTSADQSPSKAVPHSWLNEKVKYPTPIPTSSTGIVSSSPPQLPLTRRRQPLQRTVSALSERAPLASVPSIELDAGGEETLLGRSGKSSSYQLSTSKLISRVHVRAVYIPASPPKVPFALVRIVCTGWNGLKIHCQGQVFDLEKDDVFEAKNQEADIIVDVQDARVLLQWPKPAMKITTPESSPLRGAGTETTPLRNRTRLESPISPTPQSKTPLQLVGLFDNPLTSTAPAAVQIYEDPPSGPEDEVVREVAATQPTQSTQRLTQPLGNKSSFALTEEDFSDNDEENDPVVHSFGPFGENLLPRMASFNTNSPPVQRQSPNQKRTLESSENPRKRTLESTEDSSPLSETRSQSRPDVVDAIVNHVINQLAYSRQSSTPLSTIWTHLPSELKSNDPYRMGNEALSLTTLRHLIEVTACLGEVARQGKDAAGKPLENEFYYLPEHDLDIARREAVMSSLRKPGLRNCRKQHKQYFWRKPK